MRSAYTKENLQVNPQLTTITSWWEKGMIFIFFFVLFWIFQSFNNHFSFLFFFFLKNQIGPSCHVSGQVTTELWFILVQRLQKVRRKSLHTSSGSLTLHWPMNLLQTQLCASGSATPKVQLRCPLWMLSGREGGEAAAWLSLCLCWSCLVLWLTEPGWYAS